MVRLVNTYHRTGEYRQHDERPQLAAARSEGPAHGASSERKDRWLADVAPKKCRPRTVEDYRDLLTRYVRPRLGAMRLDRISTMDVERMIHRLSEQGLSPRTIQLAHSILRVALEYAVHPARCLLHNPAKGAQLPKRHGKRMRALDPAEWRKLREALRGDRFEALFLFLGGTGARPAEALGTGWDQLDLDAGTVTISRTLARRRAQDPVAFAPTKTGRERTVPLPAGLVAVLRALRARQAEERLRVGRGYRDHGLVFTDELGLPPTPMVMSRQFKAGLKRAGLESTVRIYDLRHTFASLALAAGAHVVAVSEWLGHSSTKMTLDVYAHAVKSMRDDASGRLDGALLS